ncbi:MAG TPA: hypothetical protein DDZ80_28305 [Cyanobacteria bacterium UBA8803]|nr:hypothetical protein [Cyanobacteria bacterium UBA9273]HBL62164.1 hypothetical protein [Cyanobacteria bacterium UBA8803]
MTNLISGTIERCKAIVKELQIKRFLAVVLVGFLLLTTNIDRGRNAQGITTKIDHALHQEDTQRPQTTGEWNREARETKGAPGERLQRIGEDSAEALKEWGALYPDTVQRSVGSSPNTERTGNNRSNRV